MYKRSNLRIIKRALSCRCFPYYVGIVLHGSRAVQRLVNCAAKARCQRIAVAGWTYVNGFKIILNYCYCGILKHIKTTSRRQQWLLLYSRRRWCMATFCVIVFSIKCYNSFFSINSYIVAMTLPWMCESTTTTPKRFDTFSPWLGDAQKV